MTINIMNEYIELTKKQIDTYMKLVFENKFIKKYNEVYKEKYINIRYYNFYENDVDSNVRRKILDHLKSVSEDLMINDMENREIIEKMCLFFYYVLYFDNVTYCKDLKVTISKIAKLRKKILNKDEQDFENNLYNSVLEFNKQKEKLINKFETNEFFIKMSNYKDKINIYRVNLKHNFKIPLVYSQFAINKAFNNGLVNEDKLKVEYYLVTIKILKDIIKLNFNKQYIVEFADTLLSKPKKLKSILNILNSTAIQDKVCLKIRYEEFIKNKEIIYNLMRQGFKIAIILDNSLKLDFKNIESLEMFEFIILNKNLEYYEQFKEYKNKKIKNKIIEV